MTAPPRVIIAEHDHTVLTFLAENLTADGYATIGAPNETVAVQAACTPADILLIDVNGYTLTVVDTIRKQLRPGINSTLPILVLTSDREALTRTRLLERGADDVLTKPFSYPELRARLAAVLRRSRPERSHRILSAGALRVDVAGRHVTVGDVAIRLSGKEYQLLLALLADPGRVFTRQELMRAVWDCDSYGHSRTLDSHAARLRGHLRTAGVELVHNIRGVGYRLTNIAEPI